MATTTTKVTHETRLRVMGADGRCRYTLPEYLTERANSVAVRLTETKGIAHTVEPYDAPVMK